MALHLLDDDLSVLSRGRDGDASGALQWTRPRRVRTVAGRKESALDRRGTNDERRSLIGLLRWAGLQLDEYYQTLDLDGEGHVSWASDEPVPTWLDIAREFTERWVHQMQIREAIDRVEQHAAKYLPTSCTRSSGPFLISTTSALTKASRCRSTLPRAEHGTSDRMVRRAGHWRKAKLILREPPPTFRTTRDGAGSHAHLCHLTGFSLRARNI